MSHQLINPNDRECSPCREDCTGCCAEAGHPLTKCACGESAKVPRDERAEFEKWCRGIGNGFGHWLLHDLSRYEHNGEYQSSFTVAAWQAWQARSQAPSGTKEGK